MHQKYLFSYSFKHAENAWNINLIFSYLRKHVPKQIFRYAYNLICAVIGIFIQLVNRKLCCYDNTHAIS